MSKKILFSTMMLALCMAAGETKGQRGLLISELLYQVTSGGAEYVELYNADEQEVNLKDYHIVRVLHDTLGTRYALPDYEVEGHGYVVLTRDADAVARTHRVRDSRRVVECHLPPYPDGGGSVVLCRADSSVADRLDYSAAMHSRLLRNKAGVSLERRSFDRGADEVSNWFSASSTCGYGTPGYENSQSEERLAEENDFDFGDRLLSPDGDDYQDVLRVGYRLDDGSLAARAEVYDSHGRMVRRLMEGDLLGAEGTIEWDGRDQEGRVVGGGQYVINIMLYDTWGIEQRVRQVVAVVR